LLLIFKWDGFFPSLSNCFLYGVLKSTFVFTGQCFVDEFTTSEIDISTSQQNGLDQHVSRLYMVDLVSMFYIPTSYLVRCLLRTGCQVRCML